MALAIGTVGNDNLIGTEADDDLQGLNGSDILIGLAGDDGLKGGPGADVLEAGAGNDELEGGTGADLLRGGGDFDVARYKSANARVTASLSNPASNTGDARGDKYSSIEALQGSDFNDTLIGNGVGNVLIGGKGGDLLNGRGGFDFARYNLGDVTRRVTANLADPSLNTGVAKGDRYISIEGI